MSLVLTGGVTPVAVVAPAVGLLARLSLACYLSIPLRHVAITSVANGTASLAVDAGDAVNVANGSCLSLSPLRRRRELVGYAVGQSMNPVGHRGRELGGSDTTVSLLAVVSACTSVNGTVALSEALSALLAALSSTSAPATAGNGSTVAASNYTTTASAGPLLGAFLAAAAGASGVPASAVGAVASAGTPWPAASATGATGSDGGSAAPFPFVAVIAAVVGVVALLVIVAFLVVLKRRGETAAEKRGSALGFSGVNPMRRANGSGSSEKRSGNGLPEHAKHVGAPDGMQTNPMRGAAPAAPSLAPAPSGRLYPTLGTATALTGSRGRGSGGLSSTPSVGGGGAPGSVTMTHNPMMAGGEGAGGAAALCGGAASDGAAAGGGAQPQQLQSYANRKAVAGVGGPRRGGGGARDSASLLSVREGPSASSASAGSRGGGVARGSI